MESKKSTIYNERSAVAPLQKGETVLVRGIGNSMVPILKSGQIVKVAPTSEAVKGDIVLARVRGRIYLHKVTAVRKTKVNTLYQISNNRGRVNGWTMDIYGKVV